MMQTITYSEMYQDLYIYLLGWYETVIFMLAQQNQKRFPTECKDIFRTEDLCVLTFTVANVRLLEYDLVNLHKRFYMVRQAIA
jgi:hypothetical protein